jgi:AP-2 complex subunit alpha
VILVAGDNVAEQVWHRVVQVVLNHKDIHEYAADKMFTAVASKYCHPVGIALAAYLLGEIGVSICDRRGRSGYDQFAALHQHFALESTFQSKLFAFVARRRCEKLAQIMINSAAWKR